MAKNRRIKKIKCLNPQQQDYYERLTLKQRKYCDFRTAGYGKRDAYVRAGYKASDSSAQAAYILEKRDEMLAGIIETRLREKMSTGIYDPNSKISQQINSAVSVSDTNAIMEVVENASPAVAEQIQFYRDIVAGKIVGKKKTTMIDKAGIKSYKIETNDDVRARMDARKQLDKILGINKFIDIGSVEMGDITINIVDTSKKERTADETPRGSIYKAIEEDEFIIVNEEDIIEQKVKNEKDLNIEKPAMATFKRGRVE